MLRKILKGVGILFGLLAVGVAGLFGYALHKMNKTYDLPLPNIQRNSSPEGVARGQRIFKSICAECHAKAGEVHAVGKELVDAPAFLGTFHSANITSDPVAGIGNMKDEEIARMVIHSINREGKLRPMPSFFYMADEDIAAVIGYLRSDSPDFAPSPQKNPPSQLSTLGKVVVFMVGGVHDTPRPTVTAPPKGNTPEYGRYLALSVYDCLFCHAPGLADSNTKEKEEFAWAGGFEFDLVPLGGQGFMYSANITPHETQGIGKWNLEQFKLALREGITPARNVLRPPMPRYRYMEDSDIEAMFTYLKTVTPKESPKPANPPAPRPMADTAAAANPEKLFSTLGCTYCHGPTGQFREKLKNAVGKQPEEVAKWIRNPESFKPGTQMPTFAPLIDENQAVELAKWVQAKNGAP